MDILKIHLEAAGKDYNSKVIGDEISAVHVLHETPEEAPAEFLIHFAT